MMKAEGVDPADATKEDWLDAIDKIDQAAESGQMRASPATTTSRT